MKRIVIGVGLCVIVLCMAIVSWTMEDRSDEPSSKRQKVEETSGADYKEFFGFRAQEGGIAPQGKIEGGRFFLDMNQTDPLAGQTYNELSRNENGLPLLVCLAISVDNEGRRYIYNVYEMFFFNHFGNESFKKFEEFKKKALEDEELRKEFLKRSLEEEKLKMEADIRNIKEHYKDSAHRREEALGRIMAEYHDREQAIRANARIGEIALDPNRVLLDPVSKIPIINACFFMLHDGQFVMLKPGAELERMIKANADNLSAQVQLGSDFNSQGKYDLAERYLKVAALRGEKWAQYLLIALYFKQKKYDLMEQYVGQFEPRLRQLADEGDVNAQRVLVQMYMLLKNPEQMNLYLGRLRDAAEAGNVDAQFNIIAICILQHNLVEAERFIDRFNLKKGKNELLAEISRVRQGLALRAAGAGSAAGKSE